MQDEGRAEVLVDSDILEGSDSNGRNEVSGDGFQVRAELDVDVDLAVWGGLRSDPFFGEVGVSPVAEEAVDLVGHVPGDDRHFVVLDGENVPVQKVSIVGGVGASGEELVVFRHFVLARQDLRKLLEVFDAFLGALKLSGKGDVGSILATAFAKSQSTADLTLGSVLDGFLEVGFGDEWHPGVEVQAEFIRPFAASFLVLNHELLFLGDRAVSVTEGGGVLDVFTSCDFPVQTDDHGLGSGDALLDFSDNVFHGGRLCGRADNLLSGLSAPGHVDSKVKDNRLGEVPVEVNVDMGVGHVFSGSGEDERRNHIVARQDPCESFPVEVEVPLLGFEFNVDSKSFLATDHALILERLAKVDLLCVTSFDDWLEFTDSHDSSVLLGVVLEDLEVPGCV